MRNLPADRDSIAAECRRMALAKRWAVRSRKYHTYGYVDFFHMPRIVNGYNEPLPRVGHALFRTRASASHWAWTERPPACARYKFPPWCILPMPDIDGYSVAHPDSTLAKGDIYWQLYNGMTEVYVIEGVQATTCAIFAKAIKTPAVYRKIPEDKSIASKAFWMLLDSQQPQNADRKNTCQKY